jgi:hypothetical protein
VGRMLVYRHPRLHTKGHAGMRQLQHGDPDVRQLRSVGHVHGRRRLLPGKHAGLPEFQRRRPRRAGGRWHPNLQQQLHVGELRVQYERGRLR